MRSKIKVPTRLIQGLVLNGITVPEGESIVFPGDWDIDYVRVQDHDIYDKLHQFYFFGINQKFSNHFMRIADKIRRTGAAREQFYKEADAHLEALTKAYRRGRLVGLGKNKQDEPNFAIGRNGDIFLADGGRTRAILAMIMGVKEIYGQVSIRHPEWDSMRNKLIEHSKSSDHGNYQELVHPDLQCVRGWYTRDRANRILELALSVKQFNPNFKTMIDIGTNSGNLCEIFEDAGFVCMGVEIGNANCMKAYRRASRRSYSILSNTNALDLTCPWKCDVLIMLNILHHLYRENADKLKARLKTVAANRIVFTAPHVNTGFKTQDEFAEWVSQSLSFPNKLTKIESDGVIRPNYPQGRFTYVIDRI